MGKGRGFTPSIPAGPGTTEALSFVSKQCVALTHGSCICSAGCPNISSVLSESKPSPQESLAALPPRQNLTFYFLPVVNEPMPFSMSCE